ncbi:MAG: 2,3-bisphosphoglycerate-independent phosphoglycerate mutase [Myxococcota bacterium]
MSESRPVCLVILDGFGLGDGGPGDATSLAETPFLRRIRQEYPHAQLETSGPAVGLPPGQMGNSEVGHMTLGAGRVIEQNQMRIRKAIEAGELASNPALQNLVAAAERAGGRAHLMGLVSDGGVHSSLDHLYGIANFLHTRGVRPVLHAFTDGRDTPPTSARSFLEPLEERLRELGGCIATVSGRYWAMDRDRRWDRVARAYRAIVLREGQTARSAVEAVERAYARDEGDEFIEPTVVGEGPALGDGDAVLFFNYRADRARELSNVLTRIRPELLDRETSELPRIELGQFVTLTVYDEEWDLPAVFPQMEIPHTLGEIVAASGMRQLRIAETEKYAHVTYFFSGGREEPFRGEDRILIPSPVDVPTYDQKPEMSAVQLTDALLEAIGETEYDFVLVNYANPDMVGHTGVIGASVRAVEVVDACLDRLTDAVLARGGTLLITSDHGNIEQLLDQETGGAHTAHTTNPVPVFWLASGGALQALESGGLPDVAVTLCGLLGIEAAPEMTGKSLIPSE